MLINFQRKTHEFVYAFADVSGDDNFLLFLY